MIKAISLVLATVIVLPLFFIFGTLFAGIAAMIVGWFFPFIFDTLRELFNVSLTNFQIGATLGFFGSAFKSYYQSNS